MIGGKMYNVKSIRQFFIDELKAERFSIDRSGQKTIEFLGASFMADEPSIFGKPNKTYIDAEIDWYKSKSSNINDIYSNKEAPKAWQMTANKHGEINSNYGLLIYSSKYYNQYIEVLNELLNNPQSRRGTMVYNRPSIWIEATENGKNDFICTNAVSYYIRDNKLNAVVQMRSNDVVFGYKNDYAWQRYVLESLCRDYNNDDWNLFENDVQVGEICWQVQNLHVYERHFDLVY